MENQNKLITNFQEGFNLIFKKWSCFRLALDNTPSVMIQYIDDMRTKLEINHMLELVQEDVINEINKERSNLTYSNIADALLSFIQEFFDLYMEDQSEEDVAKCLVKLYLELEKGEMGYLEKLRAIDAKTNFGIYSIEFPLTGKYDEKMIAKELERKMMVDSEEGDEDEEEEDEEDENNNTNNNANLNNVNNNNLNQIPDDDGFVVVKKGKKY